MLTLQLSIFVAILLSSATLAAAQLALPGCPDRCGDVVIPYPFGIAEGCYLGDEFIMNCIELAGAPPTPYMIGTAIPVSNISLDRGELRIMQFVASDCYDSRGNKKPSRVRRLDLHPPFTISGTKNKFIAVGCDTYAIFEGYRGNERYITGCMSFCETLGSVEESCSGIGCCQTSIPSGLEKRTVKMNSYYNHAYIYEFNPCSYSFIVEDGQFEFSRRSFEELKNISRLPMVLNWQIGDVSCDEAQKKQNYACMGNSTCVDPINLSGYFCQCLPGYEGNPYLPDGCHEIDECKSSNTCSEGACVNTEGNYSCICPEGYVGDGTKAGTGCKKGNLGKHWKMIRLLIISLVMSLAFLVLLVGSAWTYWGARKRKFIQLKEQYFIENGGFLLQQKLANNEGSASVQTTKIFTAEELEKATNNYHEDRVIGEGGYGTVYKGILIDNKVVAIKRCKIGAPTQSEQFVNEVIVLSQVNHRNVVRLLGCCFETPVPLLVYEFITNGTLHEHIHVNHTQKPSLPWELRLKIAAEIAGALAYLHSSVSMPIIHRDVKSTNVLIDDNYTAKVSDFGASRLVPLDKNQVTTLVQGTMGYLDPEYFHSSLLTEKSDVYSFGVVLVELLTSKIALSFDRPEEERNLASFFVCSAEEGRLNQILDENMVNDRNVQTLNTVADLAKRCLRVTREERPTMKEVAMELEGMKINAKHPWGKTKSSVEDTEYLLGSSSFAYVRGSSCSSSATINAASVYESMRLEMLMAYDNGR